MVIEILKLSAVKISRFPSTFRAVAETLIAILVKGAGFL